MTSSCLCPFHLLMLTTTGAKDPSHFEENRPVFRTSRLCQTDHTARGSHGLLQGLFTQPAQYCPVRWHRSCRLWGQRNGKRSVFHTKSIATVHQLCILFPRPWSSLGWTGIRVSLIRGWWSSLAAALSPAHVDNWRATRWHWSAPACKPKVRRINQESPCVNTKTMTMFKP